MNPTRDRPGHTATYGLAVETRDRQNLAKGRRDEYLVCRE
jgi:hypothetical protein